jgi:NAD(P)-dependent dehydrogenase (short-subunit alcohol dehydrogenase family)
MGSVLVTGCSTGIGRATTLRLDRLGWEVFAGLRREEDAASLRAECSERLRPVRIDVTDEESIAAAAEEIGEATGGRLDGLVNNAGIAVPGPLETLPLEDFRRQLEVNLTGQLAVTQATLPLLREARGRIVLISSIGGRIALPFNGPYSVSKFGLEALGDVLRQELEPSGIRVSLIEPGSIATPIWDKGAREADEIEQRADPRQEELYGERIDAFRRVARKTGERGIEPDKVAERVEHALTAARPKTRYLVGLDAQVRARIRAVLPDRQLDRMIAAGLRRMSGS